MLAIPQKEKAKVTILGSESMKVGDNTIQIQVLAEDGVTSKNYQIIVHQRNEQEEQQYKQEQQIQAEKLSAVLEQEEKEENRKVEEEKKKGNIAGVMGGIVIGISIIGLMIYRIKKK